MATKRRKTAKRRSSRRRGRIGAAGGIQGKLINFACIGGGILLAVEAKKMFTTVSPMILGAGEAALGVLLPSFIKNNAIVDGIATGLMAKGAMDLLTSAKLITGFGSVPLLNPYMQPSLSVSLPKGELASLGALHSN